MKIDKRHVIFAMSKNNAAVARVPSGSHVTFETCDCFFDQITDESVTFSELDWNTINPATGPVYVEGAQPGDILKVEIKKMTLNRDYAIMATGKNLGVLGDELTDNAIYKVPVKDNQAFLPKGIKIDLNPMIGVIGVAPKGDDISCGVPCEHGGNMDCKEIKAGVSLYLPVNVPGALFALGDLHAAMGDGEVSVSGLEISGEVEVVLSVLKGHELPTPLIVSDTMISTIASAVTLDDAATLATKKMVTLLKQANQLTAAEIITLLSVSGDLKICQVVDPQKTCRFELPQSVLRQINLSLE
ncbi:amidase [Orbus hercynius]|uniref:Amidase n=1 Tax=Orbus hercynius TaxID=593135 RepID=A0A495RCR6_9GAMM|nr:acetamidase/formamidase family protein [Orbus hercynius]RKS84808.1 amidase [Orbus hercynius]